MKVQDEIKILAVVVTYYPNVEETQRNIQQFIEDVDSLIIWENTPVEDIEKYKFNIDNNSGKILYMGIGCNVYIASALNHAVNYGFENNFTHILTLDQDSYFETDHFRKYVETICKYKSLISIFGPNPNYSEPGISDIPVEKSTLITSGNIVKLEVFKNIGLYREDYKIDCVDYEFCFRAYRNGCKSYMVNSVLLKQEFGVLKKTRLGYYISNYSPVRLYFIARNNIKLYREYPDFIEISTVLSRIMKPFVKIILSEPKKASKLLALFRGAIAGVNSKNSITNI